jgi:hypothetical protein
MWLAANSAGDTQQTRVKQVVNAPTEGHDMQSAARLTHRNSFDATPSILNPVRQAGFGSGFRLVLVASLAGVLVLGTAQLSYALVGDDPFSMRVDGELWISSGEPLDWASAYPNQRVYELIPLGESADRAVTGCSGSIALSAAPPLLTAYARLESDPGPGCEGSYIQGVSEVKDTLRFWASPENIRDPLRLDLEFDFSGIETYDVAGWPDAQKYLFYTLEFSLIKITQTYPDGSIELGDTVGTITANAGFDNDGVAFYEIIDEVEPNLEDNLDFETSDPGGAFGPGQTLTLHVTTERGAQIALWSLLAVTTNFDNDGDVSVGTEVAIVEADFGNSLELVHAVVRNPMDESIVTDSGLTAESGFDYLAVPEPGGEILVLTALSTLATLFRLRRRSPSQSN